MNYVLSIFYIFYPLPSFSFSLFLSFSTVRCRTFDKNEQNSGSSFEAARFAGYELSSKLSSFFRERFNAAESFLLFALLRARPMKKQAERGSCNNAVKSVKRVSSTWNGWSCIWSTHYKATHFSIFSPFLLYLLLLFNPYISREQW